MVSQAGIAFAVRPTELSIPEELPLTACRVDDLRMYVERVGGLKIRLLSTTTGIGAAYGTAKSGIGIAGVGTFRSDLIMKVRSE